MVKISVIIPVYNVEKYLGQCLDSVCSQTFGDIEIICINDGSTDNSLEILNEFADNDSRIKIFTQPNLGVGAARNKGIEISKGEYVYFTDSDDFVEPTALEETYGICQRHNLDFLIFKVRNFNDITGEEIEDDYYSMPYLKERVADNVFSYVDIKDMGLKLAVNVYGNLYKRDLIDDLRFPEGLIFEDNVFFAKALFKAERICFYDRFLYNRRKRSDSLSTKFSTDLLDTINITDLLLDLAEEYGYSWHKKELYYRIFNNIYQIFKKVPEESKNEWFLEIQRRYRRFSSKWENDEYFKNELPARFRHIYRCALESENAEEFELKVNSFNSSKKENRFSKLIKRFKR